MTARRHKKKLGSAQGDLAEREVDLVSYGRVIADMTTRRLPPFSSVQAIAIVTACRDALRRDCEKLRQVIEDLERST